MSLVLSHGTVRSRLAPTPSGYLHVGNALNFLLTWLLVRAQGGTLRLRIDDLDAPRARPGYLADIFETLQWLDIDWDEGPRSVAEQEQVYSQSLRHAVYDRFLQRLQAGGRVFACTCSRKEIRDLSPDGQYPGTCLNKRLPLDTPEAAWRVATPERSMVAFEDRLAGPQHCDLYREARHFIIRRKDGMAAYQVASLADDLEYGINLIVRGADLLGSTASQLYLARLLGETEFEQATFYHHPLIRDEVGEKLSKSAGSISLQAWRAEGKTAADFYRWFAEAMGWGGIDRKEALLEAAGRFLEEK